jgi:hypothetical protein
MQMQKETNDGIQFTPTRLSLFVFIGRSARDQEALASRCTLTSYLTVFIFSLSA